MASPELSAFRIPRRRGHLILEVFHMRSLEAPNNQSVAVSIETWLFPYRGSVLGKI
jgi:hypothetical protein